MMNLNKKIMLAVTLIIMLVSGTYVLEDLIKAQGSDSGTLIKITNNGKTAAYISDEVLQKLIGQELKNDTLSKGPTLLTALNAAGAGSFKEIEVKGKAGERPVIFNQNTISQKMILYPAGNGRVNLCMNEASNLLVKEVHEIDVRN